MDCPTINRLNRLFHETTLVESVRMNSNLCVCLFRNSKARIYGLGRGTPVFMKFEAASSRANLLDQRIAPT